MLNRNFSNFLMIEVLRHRHLIWGTATSLPGSLRLRIGLRWSIFPLWWPIMINCSKFHCGMSETTAFHILASVNIKSHKLFALWGNKQLEAMGNGDDDGAMAAAAFQQFRMAYNIFFSVWFDITFFATNESAFPFVTSRVQGLWFFSFQHHPVGWEERFLHKKRDLSCTCFASMNIWESFLSLKFEFVNWFFSEFIDLQRIFGTLNGILSLDWIQTSI